MSGFWAFDVDRTESWAYCVNAFTADECEQIIAIGESHVLEKGKVRFSLEPLRKSDIVFLWPDEKNKWIFERVVGVITSLNQQFFRFGLTGLGEGLQFTRYKAPGERYGRHLDSGVNIPIRKLSFTLQLSHPDTYEGGDLCLHLGENPTKVGRGQGYVAVFPSWTLHEVEPVTKGIRYSLVAWATGKPFV
ncbi:MAG: 2OG-Fe(II) oxygenase [Betaproteobacteria bacterium]|nr:2OG-Fe(II) oxygenase [Betaproteobacteria bacterium]